MATALDHYEDFISCTICFLPFEGRDPRLLPCPSGAHPFCMVCIQEVYDTAVLKDAAKKTTITCPKCQTTSQIPGGKLGNLPRYIQAGQVTDLWTQVAQEMAGNSREDIKICSICRIGEVNTYCFSCTKRLCAACDSSHGSTRLFQNHIKVNVTRNTIKSLVCSEHDLMIIAYCSACWKAVCTKCMLTSHRDHTTEDFVVKHPTVNPTTAIKDKEDSIANQQTILDAMLQDFDDYERKADDLIKAQKAKLIQRIEAEEQAIRRKMQFHRSAIQTRLNEAAGDLNDAKQVLQETKTKSQNITNPIPEVVGLSLARSDQLLGEVQRNMSKLQPTLPRNDQQSFASDEICPIAFGVQTSVRITSNLSAPIIEHLLLVPRYHQPAQRLLNYTRLKAELMFFEDLPDKHLGGFLPDGNLLLFIPGGHFGSYATLVYSLYNRSLSYEDWCDVIPGSGWGYIVCSVSPRAHIFALMQHGVVNVASATGANTVSTSFDVCAKRDTSFLGIESDNKVVICVGHQTQLRNTSGQFVWELVEYSENGHKLRQQALSHSCDALIVGFDDTLLISDGDPQPVTYVYDKQWQILRCLKLGTRCPQYLPNMCYLPINYMCTDSSGNIFLADFDAHAVKLFDSQGQFIAKLVDLGGGNPSDIYIYEDRYLAVGVCGEGFRVYDLQRN